MKVNPKNYIMRGGEPPHDAVRRWPTGLPFVKHLEEAATRPIDVRIHTWVGTTAIEATHYELSVEEKKNCWWSEEEDAWIENYSDTGAVGLSVDGVLQSYEDCVNLAIQALLIIAGKDAKKRPINWGCPKMNKMPTKVLKALKRKK